MILMQMLFILLSLEAKTLASGDGWFRQQRYDRAIGEYTSLQGGERSAETYWRIARAFVCAGDIAPFPERKQQYENALHASAEALRLDSSNSNAHTWYAVSLGSIAVFEGSRMKVEYCRRIQRSLERAIALDPANDVAYSVLGTFYRMLANVGWMERQLADLLLGGLPAGGYAEAERMLLKAVSLAPSVLRHHYELGLVYVESGRLGEAEAVFRHALTLPKTLASDEERIAAIRHQLKQ
ncbi:MAG: hypothetical protein HUU02_02345 [Bacteroidetes bacterium]|nr:hypothetical protein [Bacteroidota bacterium]